MMTRGKNAFLTALRNLTYTFGCSFEHEKQLRLNLCTSNYFSTRLI